MRRASAVPLDARVKRGHDESLRALGGIARMMAAVLAVAIGAPAAAYTVKSSVECPDIVREDAHETYREMNKWWLMGYFTGRNYADDGEIGKAVEDEEIYQLALDHCRENPADDWDDAAIHVYDQLD